MMKSTNLSRATEMLGILAIGDGIVALHRPSRHARLWSGGAKRWKALMEGFARRPALTRGLALAEIALGLWLAKVATDQHPWVYSDDAKGRSPRSTDA